MADFFIIAVLTFIVLISLSLFFGKKESPLQYLIPIIVLLISIVLVMVSFVIGDFEGMGMGMAGFALFIGAAIALIITAIINSNKELKKHIF